MAVCKKIFPVLFEIKKYKYSMQRCENVFDFIGFNEPDNIHLIFVKLVSRQFDFDF